MNVQTPLYREVEKLKRWGLSDDLLPQLAKAIESIPSAWKRTQQETVKSKKTRRSSLAEDMRHLASKLEADPDARWFKVWDSQSIMTTPVNSQHPTLAEYLVGAAELLEELGVNPLAYAADEMRTTRISLKDFVKREVKSLLASLPLIKKGAPNAEAANIVNALLALPPAKRVTRNDIAKIKLPKEAESKTISRPLPTSTIDSFLFRKR